jgi:ABC-type arginine transport system ATPase subunit
VWRTRALGISRSIRGRGVSIALQYSLINRFDNDRVMPRSQWQRIALARAFMRAHQPEVHFLLFDEPVRPPLVRSLSDSG